ncbi:hypothetical protein K501DRAFT_306069 [Backusella circina FSU 941]|nr:hypothetical protein K501DRAFT_306069 [Backusella circina FSU 941]
MSDFTPTIRNPLIDTKRMNASTSSFTKFLSTSLYQLSSAAGSARLGPKKKIVPHLSSSKSSDTGLDQRIVHRKQRGENTEPLIHYNGPLETLDQLPEEKLNWITKESLENSNELRHPLLDYPRSIVFRKPRDKRQAFSLGHYTDIGTHFNLSKPKASFYIRVLQVINQSSSKPSLLRSSLQLNQEVFEGSFAVSSKCGKNGSQANIDETFILDVDRASTAILSVFSQPKSAFGAINSRFKQPEVCIGTEVFQISLRPSDKRLKRITLNDSNDKYQLLVIYGTYVNSRVMTLIDNRRIHEGFITKWTRYWGVLYPGHFELYDFEYKETKEALYKISIEALCDVFHPPTDDDERLVDVGSLGLALQFSKKMLDSVDELASITSNPDFEYRMYVLPDNRAQSKKWEQSFLHAASLIQEFRFEQINAARAKKMDVNSFTLDDVNEQSIPMISPKFLW